MRLAVVVSCVIVLAACVDISAGKGGGQGDDDQTSADAGLDSSFRLEGAGCGTDAITGVTLCLAVNACPDVILDPELWPGCGFRLGPVGFDLQCVCDDELCPIGTPLTCEQIPALLEEQSQLLVCAARGQGHCVRPTGQSSSGGSSTPTCDRACAQQCGGEFGCLEKCGCT